MAAGPWSSKQYSFLSTLLLIFLISILQQSTLCSSTATKNDLSSLNSNDNFQAIQSLCTLTPYPEVCLNSLTLPISFNLPSNILNFLLHSLQNAIDQANLLTTILSTTTSNNNIIEKQKGTIQDCEELHQSSLISLQKSVSKVKSSRISDAKTFLSAALTNKDTCLEGLATAYGPQKQTLVNSITDTYKQVGNSLSLLSSSSNGSSPDEQQEDEPSNDDDSVTIIVAKDGSGNFTSVQDAVNFAPNNSEYRTFIYLRQGVYEENVEIPSYKPNIVLIGDGRDNTVITGNRSVDDGWTTFRSATVAVSGDGFLARDLTFENTAGPKKHQAAALRINADLAAVYRCNILGYQDTLYVHSFRQFFRECDIYGTVDYIFGNAAVVFQQCNIVTRMPLPGQFTVITAQGRDLPEENTGISIQNCSILATEELYTNGSSIKSYLGRPWRNYARTVYIESYIDGFVDPLGWTQWSVDSTSRLESLYYGEYGNQGPGSTMDGRVNWSGYHIMDYDEASNFTVSQFIVGDEWLDSTAFPYDDGI